MSVVTSGILFAINTTGGGKAKLQFMAVAAGVALAAKAFVSFAKEAQSLHQAFIRLTDAQRFNLSELEKLNKGMIDTGASVKTLAMFAKAGMDDVGGLTKAMTKLVIDEGQKMGKTAEEMTADFIKLGEGIAKGSTRSLKTFGVDLVNTEDLLLAQEEAIEKVTARAAGLTVELATLSEQTFAAKNSWDTYTGLLWGSVGKSGAMTALTNGLDDASDAMILAGDNTRLLAQADFIAAYAGERLRLSLLGQTEQAAKYDNVVQGLLASMRRVAEMDATIEKFTAGVSLAGGGFAETAEVDPFDPFFEEGVSTDIGAIADLGKKSKAATKAAAKPGRGGGRARAAQETMVFTEADAAAAEMEYILGAAVKDTNKAFFDRQDIYEEEALTQEEKWQQQLETKEAEKLLSVEHHEWLMQNSADYRSQQLEAEREFNLKQAEMQKQAALARMGGFKTMFTNLSSLMQVENKKAFYIGKAAAYASTVINTAEAAMASFKAMAGIPYVGPALGAIAAGAAITAGAVQLATIKKQKFGDSGGGVSAGAVGSTGGGYLGGGGNYAAGGAGGSQVTQVTVILGEEEFHGWSIAANDKASQKGDPHFADGQAA